MVKYLRVTGCDIKIKPGLEFDSIDRQMVITIRHLKKDRDNHGRTEIRWIVPGKYKVDESGNIIRTGDFHDR